MDMPKIVNYMCFSISVDRILLYFDWVCFYIQINCKFNSIHSIQINVVFLVLVKVYMRTLFNLYNRPINKIRTHL